jgi:hypothetical protein
MRLKPLLVLLCAVIISHDVFSIANDTSWAWTYRRVNNQNIQEFGNILPFNTSDIIIAQEKNLRITEDGGNSWQNRPLPESFSIPLRRDMNRYGVFAVRPSASTIFVLAEQRIGEVEIVKEGPGIVSTDPTTWKYMALVETGVLTTFDKGLNWQIVYRQQRQEELAFYAAKQTVSLGNEKNAAVLLNKDSLLISRDGGKSWQIEALPPQLPDKLALQLLYTRTGKLCLNYTFGNATFGDKSGQGGLCFLEQDQGWEAIELPRGGILQIDEENTWYLGHESTLRSNNKSEVFISRSKDQGKTWETVFNQLWIEGRGMNRASSKGPMIVAATRGSFSPVMGQLLPISEDRGNTWYYPVFPDSLFGVLGNDGNLIKGGVADPLMGFRDIWVGADGIVGVVGDGMYLVTGRKKGQISSITSQPVSASDGISVYPNPSAYWIRLEAVPNGNGDLPEQIAIYNNLGMIVMQPELSNSGIFDISSLASGVYSVRCIMRSGKSIIKSFVIER